MEKNAKMTAKKNEKGFVDFSIEIEKGDKHFKMKVAPKFLNKKQFKLLMALIGE